MKENISNEKQNEQSCKTDVSGSADIECCGIFPTNDCSECSHFKQIKKQRAIDKIDAEYYDRNSPHYKDNERYNWAVGVINERMS